MTTLGRELDDDRTKMEMRGQAAAALLYLGEKLRMIDSRTTGKGTDAAAAPDPDAETLFRVIESEIIPRLMLIHSDAPAVAEAPRSEWPEPANATLDARDHDRFLDAVMNGSAASANELISGLLERGISDETVFLELLGSSARRLGELWEEDQCSFAEVTIGLCRLHEILRAHSVLNGDRRAPVNIQGPSVLLATACADQHVFGVVMVAEFFRRAGWRVWSEPGSSQSQVAAVLTRERFDLLGLSAACTAVAEDVAREIEAFRKVSCNSELRILVGGRLFVECPELVEAVGADGVADDARTAPPTGQAILADLESRRS